jgi:hypothetical protein
MEEQKQYDVRILGKTHRFKVRWRWATAGLLLIALGSWMFFGPGVDLEILDEKAALRDAFKSDLIFAKQIHENSTNNVAWRFVHYSGPNATGQVLWDSGPLRNAVIDEGEQSMLDCYLRATSCPTQYFIRLYNDTCTETKALSTLAGEPSTNGYAAQLIERTSTGWPTLALDSGDYQATSSTETFTASGGSWGPVNAGVLATTSDNTGKALNCLALSQSRTLASGESLQVTLRWKQQ